MITESLLQITANYSEEEKKMVLLAYSIAENSLINKKRGNNLPFIEHPLEVAKIVSEEIGLMSDAVTAVFLHEASRFNPDLLESFKSSFRADIIDMVVSLNKIATIKLPDTNLKEERYRKLIISYSKDPRVVLIKLADRLEVMRNLEILPSTKHTEKISETILLYIPLAHQLGLYRLTKELEDLFFKHSEPEHYRSITNKLKATERDREKLVNNFIIPLREKLSNSGINYTLKARTKSAYSIWKKMQIQNVPFEKVYDVFAIRFIIESPMEQELQLCWKVYSLVTEEYVPDTNRLRDWISKPKPNGYESLHTTVTTKNGAAVEVQIRTERMDHIAEFGHASHWTYKGIKREEGLNTWLNQVRTMMENPENSAYEQISPFVLGEIFVFTPSGELRQLPADATLLDFAFDIHTNLGIKCVGGKVNGRMVSLKEKLKTGDVVDIIKNNNQKPTTAWLNWVTTSKARSKIKQKIKEEEYKLATTGKEILERRLKNWKIEMSDEDFNSLIKKYKFKNGNEFYSALGEEKIDLSEIKIFLSDETRHDKGIEVEKSNKIHIKEDSSDFLIIDGKLNNIDYRMAKCCNPIYGDDVFGFVTIKEGIKIHRMSCPNAARLIENYPYRIQKVKWRENINNSSFQASIKVIIDEEPSATNAVISTINSFKASIRSFITNERASKGDFEINAQLFIPSNQELDKIIASLKKLKDVKHVSRL
ncbi:MAG: RelA/SpoT family protein [Bacteroidales bacterium]|jgi:GTP pyrophosphokinase